MAFDTQKHLWSCDRCVSMSIHFLSRTGVETEVNITVGFCLGLACEHDSQLSVNCIHIVLCFLMLSIQRRGTLTWRWSCLWSSQAHTVNLSLDFESSRGGPTLWYFPIELRRHSVDSIHILRSDCFPNTINRVGEDVGFGVGDLISLVTQQACRHPRGIFETKSAYTKDFLLFTDQFSSFME